MSGKTTAATEAAEAFARDTADHELTVLHDDGLYRHLRFIRMVEQEDGTRKPTSFYWFDIITWPGCLTINGDMETFTFSRVPDMFEFFRGHEPNYGYWAEKVRGGTQVKRYSEEKFRQLVTEHIADDSEEQWPGLTAAIAEQVLDSGEVFDETTARLALDSFEFGTTFTAQCSCGSAWAGDSHGGAARWESSHRAVAPIGSGNHTVTVKRVDGFQFHYTWEWDLSDYTHQFLWCCSAIPWGIAKYDAVKAVAK